MSVKFLKIANVYEVIAKKDTNWDETPLFCVIHSIFSQNERNIIEKDHVLVVMWLCCSHILSSQRMLKLTKKWRIQDAKKASEDKKN